MESKSKTVLSQEESKKKAVYGIKKPSPLWLRLVEVVGEDNGSTIGAAFGVKKQSAYYWRDGGSPGREKLKEFAESKGISLLWLMTGQGEKYVQPSAKRNVQSAADLAPKFMPATELPDIACYSITATTLSTDPVEKVKSMVDLKQMRNRSPEEIIALIVNTDDFETEGYRAGRHLAVVPATVDELQPGDEVVAGLDNRYLIRIVLGRKADVICLRHLARLTNPIYVRADEFKLLYRVVG